MSVRHRYTSGTHIWNGTAPNLNAMATTINTIPNFNNHSLACSLKAEAKTEAKSRGTGSAVNHGNTLEQQAGSQRAQYESISAQPQQSSRNRGAGAIVAYSDKDNNSKPIYAVRKCAALTMTLMPNRGKQRQGRKTRLTKFGGLSCTVYCK